MVRMTGPFPPRCPFCDNLIQEPKELEPKRLGDFAYGECGCGAVYVYDVTGHNLGAAFVEALEYGCSFDWDLAWDLVPGEDYEEQRVERYDLATHLVHPAGRTKDGRSVRGVLIFLRFKDEISTLRNRPNKVQGAVSLKKEALHELGSSKDPGTRGFSKQEVRKVIEGDAEYLQKIEEMAAQDPKVLNRLQQILYTPDPAMRWRAITAIGCGARVVFQKRPNFVGEFLRRLLYSASDSAATNWGAIEAVGEIIRNIPDTFDIFIRELIGIARFVESRKNVAWTIGRIGEKHPNRVKKKVFFPLIGFLSDKDPGVRGLTALALGNINAHECKGSLRALLEDTGEVDLLTERGYEKWTVGQLAKEALKKIERERSQMENERLKEAKRLFQEAKVISNQGRSLDAINKFQEALSIFEDEGAEREIANTCENLGDLHCIRGNFNQALSLYQRALAICKKKKDPISELLMIEKVIDIYRGKGNFESAMPYYMRALEVAEAASDAGRAGYYLTGIGDVYQRRGDIEKALDAYRTALSIYKQTRSGERARILEKGIAELEAFLMSQGDS